ncbi:metabolite traffic protein EboE [Olivibacter sp. CPCC 100613]|uniref:metabolite traffic protein EboE n=1 Tax=Olivibacter sp. CPCC 100613 TaxID=3079931 RepID=UPI002FF503AE
MYTANGHLTYCTNIHAGESWGAHFETLQNFLPAIKEQVAPQQWMGVGLRVSEQASRTLIEPEQLAAFKKWLQQEQLYVFTMNGFPYGAFHQTHVKDLVHHPDWTSDERLDYTKRLFDILVVLLPEGMHGGVSTSPLSYRHWEPDKQQQRRSQATRNIVALAAYLMEIEQTTGIHLHLDIEPEPDGLLENGDEFLEWYKNELIPVGSHTLASAYGITAIAAIQILKRHIQLCYDVCHFALGYEQHAQILQRIKSQGIQIGKIQASAAIKARMSTTTDRGGLKKVFALFNETTYLHQVIAKTTADTFIRYPDLPEALLDIENPDVVEWRAHFHVPLFIDNYGDIASTQDDVRQILDLQRHARLSDYIEVETYTWDVLPEALKAPLLRSVVREINWVKNQII